MAGKEIVSRGLPEGENFSYVRRGNRQAFSNGERIHLFSDLGSGETQGAVGRRIVDHMRKLSEVNASRTDVQLSIYAITQELLHATFDEESRVGSDVLLVPVLRAGLGMWGAANRFFGYPESSFVMGQKDKGTDKASVVWPKKNDLENKRVIILDPIIATGDTLLRTYEALAEATSDQATQIIVLSCYAAPQAVQKIIASSSQINFVIGCMAESVGADGYLIPPTNGDMGDKLFGPIKQ